MAKGRNYYRRMWYKLQAKKAQKQVEIFNQLMESYNAWNSTNVELRTQCSSIAQVSNIKACAKYGDDVRAHWFDTDTTKAIYAKFKNHRVQKQLDDDIKEDLQLKEDNKKVRNIEDNFVVHKAISIVNRNPIIYDRSVKINDCNKYKLA